MFLEQEPTMSSSKSVVVVRLDHVASVIANADQRHVLPLEVHRRYLLFGYPFALSDGDVFLRRAS
jgi:hypothetical protein